MQVNCATVIIGLWTSHLPLLFAFGFTHSVVPNETS
jgi:hypothetical protein